MPQTDEGEVNVNAELAVGTRIERTEEALLQLEEMVKAERARGRRRSSPRAAAAATTIGSGGGSTHRGQIRIMLVPRDQRTRTNEQIAMALRRQLAGLPGVIVRANPPAATTRSCGSSAAAAATTTAATSRLPLEIRGHDLDDARRIAQDARAMMEDTPGIADVSVGREEGRPEIAVRVDRPRRPCSA